MFKEFPMYILKRMWMLALTAALLTACSPSKSDDPADAPPSAEAGAAAQEASGSAADAPEIADARWSDIAALEARAIAAGFAVNDEGAGDPEVAVPSGTEIEARVLTRGDERAELFVFRYPAEGYAGAHARGVAPTVAAEQDAEVLVAVYAADLPRAQAVLDALVPEED